MFESLLVTLGKTYAVLMPYLEILIFIAIFLAVSRTIMVYVRRYLIKRAKTKKHISDIKILTRIVNITVFITIILIAFFAYIKSFTSLGIFVGLITAALGFALQRPITGIAAWIMIVIKRPFHIGDRVMIGGIKGDVYDFTLTHVYIDETGGLVDTEQHSGRHVMIPNYKLFDNDIINYTLINDKIIGEVDVMITFESNLRKAMGMVEEIINKHTKQFADEINKKNRVRIAFKENGVQMRALFYAPVSQINQMKNELLIDIHDIISKEKDIEFAYPRTRLMLDDSVKDKK